MADAWTILIPKQTGHSKIEAKSADARRLFVPIIGVAPTKADDVDEEDKDVMGFLSFELMVLNLLKLHKR